MTLYSLFPVVVSKKSISISNEEIKILSSENEFVESTGNYTSYNKNILDNPSLSSLKQKLNSKIQEYIDEIYKPKEEIKSYITQSWINITESGKWHHKHTHYNSFLSGVFYISVDSSEDKIYFYRDDYPQIYIESKEWTLNNSRQWFLNVSPYDVIIFPSNLIHDVKPTTSKTPRITLAFNSFISGVLGDYHSATELKL
jgi:uncharacterized protein (TIGR02466 family)